MARICIIEDEIKAVNERYGELNKEHDIELVFIGGTPKSELETVIHGNYKIHTAYDVERATFPEADLYITDGLRADWREVVDKIGGCWWNPNKEQPKNLIVGSYGGSTVENAQKLGLPTIYWQTKGPSDLAHMVNNYFSQRQEK